MRCQRMILGIRWHDFVRNTEVLDRTNLPSVRDVIAKRRNSLFGHVAILGHRALSQVAAARTGHRFGPGWRQQPGRPRHSWIPCFYVITCLIVGYCFMIAMFKLFYNTIAACQRPVGPLLSNKCMYVW